FGYREAGELLERNLGAVVVDLQLVDERGSGPAGADAGELLLEMHDRLVHAVLALGDVGVHHASFVVTSVPMGSPISALPMLPGSMTSNTMIGSALSMQNVIAVESITSSRRLSTSKCVTSS